MLFFTKRKLATMLLVFVIFFAIWGIFKTDIANVAGNVVSVLATGGKFHPIYAVDLSEKKVALSFDATWGSSRTQQLLDTLAKHNVKTTFFLTNIWLKEYPQLAKDIVAQGHEVAMHSANHPNMTELSNETALKELQDNEALIMEITGQKPYLFRPPFGAYNNRIIKLIQDAGYIPIQWSIDSLDWKNLSAEDIYKRVTNKMAPGAIVLFHNDGTNTPAALENILQFLQQENYTVVPISQLIYRDNYLIDHNGIQKQQIKTMENGDEEQ